MKDKISEEGSQGVERHVNTTGDHKSEGSIILEFGTGLS